MIITKTPVRISLCGGGTDYPDWFKDNGGIVVGGAINSYSHITARWLLPFHDFKSRVVYSRIETVNDNLDIEHNAINACLKRFQVENGIEIMHSSDMPGKSGTGSSSAFVVGVVNALQALTEQRRLSPESMARLAIQIEREDLAETGGWQDQIWAAYGGLNIIKFRGEDFNVTPITLSCSAISEFEKNLLLFFTGISRTSADVAASYASDLGSLREKQLSMMKITDHCIDAIYDANWELLGHWIDMSWRIKSSLSEKVSSNELAQMYAIARMNGAWGGKLCGAGGGGSLLLVAPPESHQSIITSLTQIGCVHVPFRFEFSGSRVVHYGR